MFFLYICSKHTRMKKLLIIIPTILILTSIGIYLKYVHDKRKECDDEVDRISRAHSAANRKLLIESAKGNNNINVDSLFNYCEKTVK